MKILPALLLCLSAAAAAQGADPLKSAACGEALSALRAARAAAAPAARLAPLRDNAASTCLGTSAMPQRPSRVMQAPIAVSPPSVVPPEPPSASLPALTPPPAPVAIQRPPAVTHCDAGGCWADDGGGLRHVPPNLAGPRGLCSQQGGLVYCP